jgi:predicted SAM-dependent methyltransferase
LAGPASTGRDALQRMTVTRINWGCGQVTRPGWINCDKFFGPGVDLTCDIRRGLPLPSDSVDYIVSIHALPEIPVSELEDVLWELRRVLRPEGVLRLGLPDLDRALDAYRRNDRDYFLIPDDTCASIGGKLIMQMLWYGRSCAMFTCDFIEELLRKAGFRRSSQCSFRHTNSPYPEIVDLDNREKESLFVEAVK